MLVGILWAAVLFVAFTNGANANFKGVASLYGSGTTSLRKALWWGTGLTLVGSLAALWLSDNLLKRFSGRGIVPDSVIETPSFCSAVALGTALTSFLATRCGFPVSTTHALLGGLAGAGLAASGLTTSGLTTSGLTTSGLTTSADHQVNLAALTEGVLVPLLFSPLVALTLGAGLTAALMRLGRLPDQRTSPLDVAHFFSTGAASFARGLNDTPKIVALLMLASTAAVWQNFLWIAIAIAVGGLLDARNVAETLGKKVTEMNPGQGFIASLVTAGLVISASLFSLPVSTTHVSVGALIGIGLATRQVHWQKAKEIVLAWLCTVPCGAVLAAISYWVLAASTL